MSRRLSAFAAKRTPVEPEEDEDVVIRYDASSSSSSEDEDEFPVLDLPRDIPAGTPITQMTTTTTVQNSKLSGIKPITVSNFKPDNDNLIFSDAFVTVGLKQSEFLLIKGQYRLTVQRGCLKIDTVLYHANEVPIDIVAPSMISIPVLYADQVIDRSLVTDERTEINEHLFSSDYKTVIKLENYFTGLEDIGLLYPPLQNVFPNNNNKEQDSGELVIRTESEEKFRNYSFVPILDDEGMQSSVIGTVVSKNWIKNIDNITDEISKFNDDVYNDNQMKIMVIGSKNSGKSTFMRTLLNHILYKTDYCIPVNMMDLDPGQPEYSQPDSVSISSIEKPTLGFNISPVSLEDDTSANKILLQKYIGYSNPNRQPQRYEQLCTELCDYYENFLQNLNQVLLINTPGWIKGYGIELLKKLTARIRPSHLLFLTPSGSNIDMDSELLTNLQFGKLIPVHGFLNAINLKYSAAQLRIFKILSYFHNVKFQGSQNRPVKKLFDFTPLIISHSPYIISYSDSEDLQFKGISLVNILMTGESLQQQYIQQCLEAVVVGIYTIDVETYQDMVLNKQMAFAEGLPVLIQNDVNNIKMKFHGLSLVHSLDIEKKLINLYTPLNPLLILQDGELIVLVRGRTEIPIEEIAPREFIRNRSGQQLPYVTFDKQVGKGGKVLKIRRNIMRRSHQ